MNANQVTLEVDGKQYGGWKRVEVQRGIEQIAGGFVLELTHRWPGLDVVQGLREGLPCRVLLDGDVVISGFIDLYEPELSDSSCQIRVEGRDRTGDLVDCSAIYKTGQWRNAPLERIVRDILAPFKIDLVLGPTFDGGDVFKTFALEDGEKAFDAIDRACRLRAVLCTSTPTGALWLGGAGVMNSGVTLQEGVNIKRISSTHTWRERYSEITLKGQVAGDDDENGPAAAQKKASGRDAEIDRYRPLIVAAEHGTSAKSLADRAAWEVAVRLGRGKRGRAVVVGWRTGRDGVDGPLWEPNTLVHVVSPRMNLDMEVLIVGCSWTLSEQGALTELSFSRPEAFELVEGVGRSKLQQRLNDKTEREKKKRGDGFVASWEREPPIGRPK